MLPDTKEEFDQFGDALVQKINQFKSHIEYPAFAEELINRISVNCKLYKFIMFIRVVAKN